MLLPGWGTPISCHTWNDPQVVLDLELNAKLCDLGITELGDLVYPGEISGGENEG